MVIYEWCYETIDEHGDILDNDHADKLSDFSEDRRTKQLCLVRNEGNNEDGLQDRYWAYVKNGKLPEFFEDGAGHLINISVPKRFHTELANYLKQTK